MENEQTMGTLPHIIRLPYAGQCGCGEPVAEGERVGYVWTQARVVCLDCMARIQARRLSAQVRHTELVAERANGLLARLIAIKALGNLCAELEPVVRLADRSSQAPATS